MRLRARDARSPSSSGWRRESNLLSCTSGCWNATAHCCSPRRAAEAGDSQAGAEPVTTVKQRASDLPAAVNALVARQPELAVLERLLAEPHVRVVTLIGPGGVGKTRLCLELARRLEHTYRDGAVLVRLERLIDPALVAAEIATAIGRSDGTDGPGSRRFGAPSTRSRAAAGDRQLRAFAGSGGPRL